MTIKSFSLPNVYRLLEPGPVVLVTTAHKGRANIMTQSWHTMMEFEPLLPASLVAAPLIAECHANLECRVADTRMVNKYNFIKARVYSWLRARRSNCRRG